MNKITQIKDAARTLFRLYERRDGMQEDFIKAKKMLTDHDNLIEEAKKKLLEMAGDTPMNVLAGYPPKLIRFARSTLDSKLVILIEEIVDEDYSQPIIEDPEPLPVAAEPPEPSSPEPTGVTEDHESF